MKPDYKRFTTMGRILRRHGFRRHHNTAVDIVAYKREANGCPEPYTRRYVWVKFDPNRGIVVSHSVHVKPDKIVQLVYDTIADSGIEMLAAIAREQTRTDHVAWEEGETGAEALRRTWRLTAATKRRLSTNYDPAHVRPHDHLNDEDWRGRPPR